MFAFKKIKEEFNNNEDHPCQEILKLRWGKEKGCNQAILAAQ